MAKRPSIQLLNNDPQVAERISEDTTAWTQLSDEYDAFRIQYSHKNLLGQEEVYRVAEDVWLRTIHSEVESKDESAATNLAGHLSLAYKLLGENTLVAEDGRSVTLRPNSLLLGYSENSESLKDQTPAGNAYAMVILSLKPEVLVRPPLELSSDCLPETLSKLLEAAPEGLKITELYHIDDACKRCLLELLDCPMTGELRRSYIRAKVQELICLTLALVNHQEASDERQSLSNSDREKLESLHQQLQDQYVKPPAIAALAKQVGMSDAKLKKSFKNLFGISISEQLQQRRMNQALILLRDGSGNINQIANSLGYEHASNFITAFKRQFGLTPKAFQKQAQTDTQARQD